MDKRLPTPGSGTTLWDVLDRIEDYLQAREDVRDGSDGVQLPNEAMSLRTELIYARVDYARKSVSSESEPTFEWIIERLDGHYWDSLSQHKALILQHVAGALQTPKAPPLFTGEDGRYEGIRTPDKKMLHVTQVDVTMFAQSLRTQGTPWAAGCADILESLWQECEDSRYADIEHEQLGCHVAKTGIYAVSARKDTDIPVCDGHADSWFTGRNHLKGDHDCIVCACMGWSKKLSAFSDGKGDK